MATETGYMNFVPWTSKEDDVIVLMLGGKVPYVLRLVPKPDDNNTEDDNNNNNSIPCRYQLIGDAYIQGVMHGEAWDESKSSNHYSYLYTLCRMSCLRAHQPYALVVMKCLPTVTGPDDIDGLAKKTREIWSFI